MSEKLTPEQVVRRICVNIERCDKALGGDLLSQLPTVPFKVRHRLMESINHLRNKLIQLGID